MLLLSPQEAVSRQQWLCLNEAASATESGQIANALESYRQVIPNLIDEGGLRWSNIDPDPTVSSRNGLCRRLIAYYTLTQTWQAWSYLAQPLLDEAVLSSLSLSERSQLISARGWATVRRRPLAHIIAEQEAALETCQSLSGMTIETAHHHLMLCFGYTLAFEEEKSLIHGHAAHNLFTEAGSIWGLMRTDEIMGTAYYTAWKYDEALVCYARLDEKITHIGESAEPMRPFYGQGWAYLGKKDYVAALKYFQSGQAQKQHANLLYDAARCQYAEGYTRFRQEDYEGAFVCQERALKTFCDDDHFALNLHNFGQGSRSIAMMAACLHNIALIYEYQDKYHKAFGYAQRAVTRQRELDDPGQMADFIRRALYLSLRCGRLDRTPSYLLEYARLRSRYSVPGFRY